MALSLLLTAGCTQLKKRSEVQRGTPEVATVGSPAEPTSWVDEDFQNLPPQLSHQTSKNVGLVLGPGGAKTLAYSGLIKSFVKNKISISHIAGTEWSSLIAASFALNGEVHDMDWKLYKLESLHLSFSKGFLGFGGGDVADSLWKYLGDNFGSQRLESGKIPFTCASRSLNARQSLFITRGAAADALKRCLPMPPFFKNYAQASSPASLLKLAKSLKDQGADIVVFVDVLDSGILNEGLIRGNESLRYLWGQVLEGEDVAKSFIKNSYSIDLRKYSMFDFSKRRQLEEEGESQGDAIAKSLINAYGL